jgi:MoxR-like ATPase
MVKEKISQSEVKAIHETLLQAKKEISQVFIGQEEVVDSLLKAILCKGHILLEGVPGIAKTLVINTLAIVSGCSSKRIQFTVDLLPTDIIGLTMYTPQKGFEVVKGPIFANFVVADEINRSPPKTQSALIEAMQENTVTIGKESYELPSPFFVMATQNALESEGVYPLPLAQVDRFLFKIQFGYPKLEEESKIMEENISFKNLSQFKLKKVLNPQKILSLQKATHKVYLDENIKEYILKLVRKTRDKSFSYGQYIEIGASPRASISLYIGSKAQALISGRNYVLPEDVRKVAHSVLRHRLILSYKAQAENITVNDIIDKLIAETKAD